LSAGQQAPSPTGTSGTPPSSAPAPAIEQVTLAFPDDGKREVWIDAAPTTGPKADSLHATKSTVDVPTVGKPASALVYVIDSTTGNMASAPLATVKLQNPYKFESTDFNTVGEVTIKLVHSDKPVAAANVVFDEKRKSQSQLLDPGNNGELHFYNVAPGDIQVTATYKSKDGAAQHVSQVLKAPLDRTAPVPTLTISVPEDVATNEPVAATTATTTTGAAAPTTAPAPTKPKDETPSGAGTAIGYLIGLIVAGGVAYGAYSYYKKNPDAVQNKLEQLGVDIPKPGDAAMQAAADPMPMPKAPQPIQKIILDNSAPDPITPVGASSVMSTGEPTLVSESGDAMKLPHGGTIVGREVGLGLSLVGETTVSRRHAQLLRSGNEVTLTDLGSTNGTFVNGISLKATTTLRPGDTVQFGDLRFRYEG